MDIDEVYKEIGEFGAFQKKIFWSFGFVQVVLALHQVHNVFIGATPTFYCKRSDGSDTLTIMGCPADDKPCDNFVFPGNDFTSIVSEWSLVCRDAYQADMAQSSVMFGILIGSLLFGYLGDKHGRRKIMYLTSIATALVTVAGVYSPSYRFYLAMRFLAGAFCAGVGMIGFVMVTEVIGQSARGFAGMMMPICFAFGLATYSLMAYLIRDWKILSLATAAPPAAIGLYLYWILPESPRWLYSQGYVDEAEHLLEIFAKKNGVHLGDKSIVLKREKSATVSQTQPTLFDVIRHPVLRSLTLNNMFTWFVNCAVYYGLTLSSGNLGANLYISVALSGIVEIPAYLMAYFLMEKIGRRWTYSISMLSGGLFCLAIILVPKYNYKTRMILAICGKMGISLSFCVAWLYSAEMYPTNIRNKALSMCNMMARLGGMICPMIVAYGKLHANMDFVILGAMTFVAGIICLRLPETRGKAMPETIESLEASSVITKDELTKVNIPEISEEKLRLLQNEIENNRDVV